MDANVKLHSQVKGTPPSKVNKKQKKKQDKKKDKAPKVTALPPPPPRTRPLVTLPHQASEKKKVEKKTKADEDNQIKIEVKMEEL